MFLGSIFHQGPIAPSGGPLNGTTSQVSFGQYNGNHLTAGSKYLMGQGLNHDDGLKFAVGDENESKYPFGQGNGGAPVKASQT
jgi:hypothetical protein